MMKMKPLLVKSQSLAAFPTALLLMIALWMRPASASVPNVSFVDTTRDSDIIVVGTLREIRGNQAQFAVEQILKGAKVARVVEVAPVARGSFHGRVFREGETLVLFLKRGPVLTIMVNGWSALTFKPETKNATIEAVKQLLKLPPRSDKDALMRAMLALATDENSLLRREAHQYIAIHLGDRHSRHKYDTELIELLKHPASDVRAAALNGLQFQRSAQALPLIIEISRGDDVRLVQLASMALANYDAPAAAAALIGLTRHANPDLRVRALIDIDNHRSPAAKAALIALLDDPDPKVRAHAPRGLVMWLRRGEAPEIVAKLIEMLNDPVAQVQVGAAWQLGETGAASAIEPLFDVLRRKDLSEEMEKAAMTSLGQLYSRLNVTLPPIVTDKLGLIIAVLERGRWAAGLNALSLLARNLTPQSLAALRHAAQNHPQSDIRDFAKRALPPENTPEAKQP